MSALPILYSFRRCPYAMRARMALWISGTQCELREVKLANKPEEMLAGSPKGTVPVLVLPDGTVIDESLPIMRWALGHNDPEGWLAGDDAGLIAQLDGPFKHHLDRYKYYTRHDTDPLEHRAAAMAILADWNARLSRQPFLCGPTRMLADMASFPFVRQFANHDREWFDAQPIPQLHQWLERHLASPIFAAIMGKQTPWQADDMPVRFPAN